MPATRARALLPTGLLTGAALACALLAGCAAPQAPRPGEPDATQRRVQARLALASAYFEQGQAATALEEVERALAADLRAAPAWSLRGLAQASLGDAAAAQASFERALQLDAGDAETRHNFAWFLCQQRRWDESQAQFERTLAQPGYRGAARSLLALGVCQARAGRTEAAQRSLEGAATLEPANAAAALALAEVLLQRGAPERAQGELQRVSFTPARADVATLWLAARIEHRLGRHAAVETLGRELRQRFPQAPQTLALDQGRFDD